MWFANHLPPKLDVAVGSPRSALVTQICATGGWSAEAIATRETEDENSRFRALCGTWQSASRGWAAHLNSVAGHSAR